MDSGSTQDGVQRLSQHLQTSLSNWRQSAPRQNARRSELVCLLCWQLKDLGWVLFCAPLAWTGALLALIVQSRDLLQQLESTTRPELAHSMAAMAWLFGNVVWMTAQLLFDPIVHKGRRSPWYGGALLSTSADNYDIGTALMRMIDGLALMGLLLFYASVVYGDRWFSTEQKAATSLLARLASWYESFGAATVWQEPPSRLSPEGHQSARRLAASEIERLNKALSSGAATPERAEQPAASAAGSAAGTLKLREEDRLIFGLMTQSVYGKVFILPWILKDLLWSMRWPMPTILCMLLAIGLMADYLFLTMKWKHAAMLLWAAGTTVWICNDLVMGEQEVWPLFLTVLLFAISACMLSSAILSARVVKATTSEREHDPLL